MALSLQWLCVSVVVVLVVLVMQGWGVDGQRAPERFHVKFTTTVKNQALDYILLNITRSNAPLGVDRLYQLLTLPGGPYYNQVIIIIVIIYSVVPSIIDDRNININRMDSFG